MTVPKEIVHGTHLGITAFCVFIGLGAAVYRTVCGVKQTKHNEPAERNLSSLAGFQLEEILKDEVG